LACRFVPFRYEHAHTRQYFPQQFR
jgi:hypothetical protein